MCRQNIRSGTRAVPLLRTQVTLGRGAVTGNLIHDNQTHDRNRLVRRGDASFEYDDDGRLTRKITSSGYDNQTVYTQGYSSF